MLKLPKQEKSFWQEFYPRSIYSQLKKDTAVDVVVVGAGITGLTSAYLVKKAGFTVAVLDKSTVGGGTTGRTTGKVTSQHNLVYSDMAEKLGNKAARIYGLANQSAVKQIETIVHSEMINCDWESEDNYVYTTDKNKLHKFRQEAKVAASLGLPATLETTTPLPFDVVAAVKFSGQAKINAQKYLLGLAHAVDGDGSYVFENSTVTRIRGGNSSHVKTTMATIRAKHIIVATNVPMFPLLARGTYCLFEYPVESYIVAGRLPKNIRGMYISPDEGNYSILPTEYDGVPHMLIGGGGHFSAVRVNRDDRYQKLANFAEDRFGIPEITHRWSDRDYLSYDGIPLVGPLYPWSKNVYVGTAFKKWGLSNGTAAAMLLRDLILGNDTTWAATFYPHRLKLITSIPGVVVENIKQYI